MTELSRRHILTGATASVALAPFAAPSVHAAALLSGKQAPSFYRSKLGDFEITVVSDGARAIPLPATFVRNISNEQVLAAAEAAYMPKGSIIAPFNPIVVNTGAKLVLIDTGYGPGLGPTVGLLPLTLAAAGIDPKAVDIVLISHMHGDHILGLKTPDGALAFPNAEIKVPSVDWAFWMNDDNMSRRRRASPRRRSGLIARFFPISRTRSRATTGARRSLPASPRSNPAATRPGTPRSSSPQGQDGCFSRATSPTYPSCSCAIPTGRSCSIMSRRRRCKPAGASTTWLRPRRSLFAAITFRSPDSVISRRPASLGAGGLESGALSTISWAAKAAPRLIESKDRGAGDPPSP